MQTLHFYDNPITVFGVPFFEKTRQLRRLPDELLAELPQLKELGLRTPGARVCFRTDATAFTVNMRLSSLQVDSCMSRAAAQSIAVFVGPRKTARFAGLVKTPDYDTLEAEATFQKSADMEDITLFLPRNEPVADLTVTLPDGATVSHPTPYAHGPILYYGSSITEGGCAAVPFNAYTALISRHLDLDYYNFGFSASAKGELPLADFINTVDIQAFVMDYDHNAPDAAYLQKTHEPFFRRIREKQPNLPILLLSMPKAVYSEQNRVRREIIRTTYQNAVAAGDRKVWFIDGETLYGEKDRELCSVDITHPNDLGFHRMSEVIEPVIREMLQI